MPFVAIGLGSNLGDSPLILQQAVTHLAQFMKIQGSSSLYATAPLYVLDQPDFVNGALMAKVQASPLEVLQLLKRLEFELGRRPRERFGPREIDLDLLTYGSIQYELSNEKTVQLQIPHPRLCERRFVLDPLAEIDPSFVIPGQGLVSELLLRPDVQAQQIRRLTDVHLQI